MAKVQLELHHVAVGQPLPFDLVDQNGFVLLKYGFLLQSQGQLNRLIERGVFFEEIFDESAPRQQAAQRVSIYRSVSELAAEFAALMSPSEFDVSRILDVARRIGVLTELDADAALANIQLYRGSAYSLRLSFHTAVFTTVLLRRLGCPPDVRLHATAGALTMNLGMLALQDVLYRQNAPLTLEQKREIVTHPRQGAARLRECGVGQPVWLEVVEHHHAMIDGTGYPGRLSKNELSIESQVVALADRYCALVSERDYRPGMLPSLAAKDLLGRQSSPLGPALAAAFGSEVGSYPPGTLVLLANGEAGVAVQRLQTAGQPLVRSLRSPNGIRYADPPKRLTSSPIFAIREALPAGTFKDVDWASLWPSVQAGVPGM
jgi:HD-GYP domain-containing protein (c-di-GMP phosphodiesterase class II)